MTDQQQPQRPRSDDQTAAELDQQNVRRLFERKQQFAEQSAQATIESGQLALRTAVLVNGGAAVAVLGFIGAFASKDKIGVTELTAVARSLIWFAFGVLAAVTAMVVAYVTSFCMTTWVRSEQYISQPPFVLPGRNTGMWWGLYLTFLILAGLTGVASLALFIWGTFDVRSAIVKLR